MDTRRATQLWSSFKCWQHICSILRPWAVPSMHMEGHNFWIDTMRDSIQRMFEQLELFAMNNSCSTLLLSAWTSVFLFNKVVSKTSFWITLLMQESLESTMFICWLKKPSTRNLEKLLMLQMSPTTSSYSKKQSSIIRKVQVLKAKSSWTS